MTIRFIALLTCLCLFSPSSFASYELRTQLGESFAKLLFGDSFVQGQDISTRLNGKTISGKKCQIDFELTYLPSENAEPKKLVHLFTIAGRIGDAIKVMVQPHGPVAGSIKNEKTSNAEYISFDSSGPCLGGLIPGTASCDQQNQKVGVIKDRSGKIVGVRLNFDRKGVVLPTNWAKTFLCILDR